MQKIKWLLFILALSITGVIGWQLRADDTEQLYSGTTAIRTADIIFEMSASPPVVAPGQDMLITLTLRNVSKATQTPSLTLQLPPTILLKPASMPRGATANLQSNNLHWMPVLPANGGEQAITIQAQAETADALNPEQAVNAQLLLNGQTQQANAIVWVGNAPQIRAVTSQTQIAVGQPVALTADIAGAGPITEEWELGDGRRLALNAPNIVYPAPGTYQIRLTASNPIGSDEQTTTLHVVPHPAAHFTADDFTPANGQAVQFTDASGGHGNLTYLWQFGDGATTAEQHPSHTFTSPGTYQVSLQISNEFGSSSATWPVIVGEPPIAEMSLPLSIPAGQPLTGQATGDGTVLSFRWDMGDGTTLDGADMTHVYRRAGEYYVLLQATNEFGQTTRGQWVYVEASNLYTFFPIITNDGSFGLESAPSTLTDLDLEEVPLDDTFILEPVELPSGMPPEDELAFYINLVREQFGRTPVQLNNILSVAAKKHTDDMAQFGFTAHMGADGSYPAERLLAFGYEAGYAGEATAWGFANPHKAVEFWINSPPHRRILLNRYATHLGVAHTTDFDSPNIWYWTAEFGNAYLPPLTPAIRLQSPVAMTLADNETSEITYPLLTDSLEYSWNWQLPLKEGQSFALYLLADGQAFEVARTDQPLFDQRYTVYASAYPLLANDFAEAKEVTWQIRLEDPIQAIAVSEQRPLTFAPDLTLLPIVTPTITITQSVTPTPLPTFTPTPDSVLPTPTPPPPPPTPVILPTAPAEEVNP